MPRKKEVPPREKLYTIDEMATLLQVDKRTLVEWVQYRRIPFVILNRQFIRFRLSDIAKWVRSKYKRREKTRIA